MGPAVCFSWLGPNACVKRAVLPRLSVRSAFCILLQKSQKHSCSLREAAAGKLSVASKLGQPFPGRRWDEAGACNGSIRTDVWHLGYKGRTLKSKNVGFRYLTVQRSSHGFLLSGIGQELHPSPVRVPGAPFIEGMLDYPCCHSVIKGIPRPFAT